MGALTSFLGVIAQLCDWLKSEPMSSDEKAKKVWSECLKFISEHVPPQAFRTWFSPVKPVKLEGKVLTIQVPSYFYYEWLEEHYVDLLRKALHRTLGPDAKLEYRIVVAKGSRRSETMELPGGGVPEHAVRSMTNFIELIRNPFVLPGLRNVRIPSNLNPVYTFDSFVEGECNRLAYSACKAVAQNPGKSSFNPLVIYGGVGLGKTHLAHAAGNAIVARFPDLNVLYVTGELFISQFIECVKRSAVNEFMQLYYSIDVLIVDDLHQLVGKDSTQEVFFNIFNRLHQNNKQIILTIDRPPALLRGFTDRLLSRLRWGLTAELLPPDYETRLAILEKKAYSHGLKVSREVLEFIAEHITQSVRDLEGMLVSLFAHAALCKREPDLALARQLVEQHYRGVVKRITASEVIRRVCEYFNISEKELLSNSRKRHVLEPRQVAMWLARQVGGMSLKSIGSVFGGKDHSTVIHSIRKVEMKMEHDPAFRHMLEELKKSLA